EHARQRLGASRRLLDHPDRIVGPEQSHRLRWITSYDEFSSRVYWSVVDNFSRLGIDDYLVSHRSSLAAFPSRCPCHVSRARDAREGQDEARRPSSAGSSSRAVRVAWLAPHRRLPRSFVFRYVPWWHTIDHVSDDVKRSSCPAPQVEWLLRCLRMRDHRLHRRS